jgi:adenylosuccinate synthase
MPCDNCGCELEVTLMESDLDHLKNIENILVGISYSLEELDSFNKVISNVNWNKINIKKKDFTGWWNNHKNGEEKRKLEEIRMQKHIQDVNLVLAKLTQSERNLLGF